jgi:hypothetical protein
VIALAAAALGVGIYLLGRGHGQRDAQSIGAAAGGQPAATPTRAGEATYPPSKSDPQGGGSPGP